MEATQTRTQQRLRKYSRDPESLPNREITERSFEIISNLMFYRILPTSLLVALIDGDPRTTARHLQTLYHKGLINRFAFPRGFNVSEFYYYLDNPQSLELLLEAAWATAEDLENEYERVRRNKEKQYFQITNSVYAEGLEGQRLFLKHEAMISRFHASLEIACNHSQGQVELAYWQQGPELWNTVTVPKLESRRVNTDAGVRIVWEQQDSTETLPHRPDAFFTLHFPNAAPDRQDQHFVYEADRQTSNTTRFMKKLRAHYQYAVMQKKYPKQYGIPHIRAVLIETIDKSWAETLRLECGRHKAVSNNPSGLFWFTHSDQFARPVEIQEGKRKKTVPQFLTDHLAAFRKIWHTPIDDAALSILDGNNIDLKLKPTQSTRFIQVFPKRSL